MEHLIVTLLGPDKNGIANEIFKLASHCGCHVVESKIAGMHAEFSATLLLAGSWNTLAKFEAALPRLEKKYEIRTLSRRTQNAATVAAQLPYLAYIAAPDTAEVIHKVTEFLTEENITIHELTSNAYKAPYSNQQMLSINVAFSIPLTKIVADFRERFALFCDDNNLDVAMEPRKS